MRQDGALIPYVELDLHLRVTEPPGVLVATCAVQDRPSFIRVGFRERGDRVPQPGRSDRQRDPAHESGRG